MSAAEACLADAVELGRRIRTREQSAVEVLEAHVAQIARVDRDVGAIVTLAVERAHDEARAADVALARGETTGALHGLPVAVKDSVDTAGIRTTCGTGAFAERVPEHDAASVRRLRAAGAIVFAKTNLPELAAGTYTDNALFGPTRNPYALDRTCGGSSGGSAVAVSCGMAPLALGTDMAASLRNPASCCNVVGLRPAPGRVPEGTPTRWPPYSVTGPLARTARDTGLLLSVLADAPDAAGRDPARFAGPLERDFAGVRVALGTDVGGLPFEPEARAWRDAASTALRALGCEVRECEPDLSGADEAFELWRAWAFEHQWGALVDSSGDAVHATIRWNVAEGRRLTVRDLVRAERCRLAVVARARAFMEVHELLLLPVNQTLPGDVRERTPPAIDGVPMASYLEPMRSCSRITVTGLPAISAPCTFSANGLPIGVQIVGRPGGELALLQLAHALEQLTDTATLRPVRAACMP